MTRNYKPYDFGIWLENIDVNALTDAECSAISSFDIEDDADLRRLIVSWIKPRYLKWDTKNREEMLEVLNQSARWSDADLREVFDQIGLPSGQEIKDLGRFIRALKAGILE